jgi:hypothetical protein
VFDAQETAQNVAAKVANTAEGVYNTVAEAVCLSLHKHTKQDYNMHVLIRWYLHRLTQ